MGQCISVAHHRTPMGFHQPGLYVSTKDCVMTLLLYRITMQCMPHVLLLLGPHCCRYAWYGAQP